MPEILLKALTYLRTLNIKIHIVNPELQTQLMPSPPLNRMKISTKQCKLQE